MVNGSKFCASQLAAIWRMPAMPIAYANETSLNMMIKEVPSIGIIGGMALANNHFLRLEKCMPLVIPTIPAALDQ